MQRTLHTWVGRYIVFFLLLTLIFVPVQRVVAQSDESESVTVTTPQSMMADQLLRIADQILHEKQKPGSSQIIRSGLLVDMAIQANPNDPDAWLMRKAMAQLAGDSDAAGQALAKYCQLRPEDDAAGFQLILARLGKMKNADQKAASIQKLLESASKGTLTEALRSRLASYLAGLYQSLGDQERFGKWLKAAAQTDPSNRDAARQMYELAVTRGGSDYAVGKMLLHMIKASPMDDMSRQLLADLLASMGAYADAQKQYLIASTLGVKQSGDQFITNWMVSLAASGHTEKMLEIINSLGYKAGQADPSAIPLDAQVLRLAILTQDGRTLEAANAFTIIRKTLQKRVDMGDVQAALELAWWTALFGPNLSPSFEKAVIAYAKANPDNVLIQRTLGWVHYRDGKLDEANKVFLPWIESDVWAVYGLAKCAENQDAELYEGYLQKTIRMAGTSPAAMLAARDLQTMGRSVTVSGGAVQLIQDIQQLPANILMPLQARENIWTTLSVEVQPTQYGYLDPMTAVVKLRNSSDIPLTLGPAGTLPSGLVIYLAPWRGGEPIKGMSPILVDIAKTIRLDARQTLRVPVRLDRGQLGLVMAQNPAASIRFSVTAILDPRTSAKGTLTTGPLGGVALAKFVDRTALRPTPGNVDSWISQFKSPENALSHMRLIALLCRLSDSLKQLPQMKEQAAQIALAVNAQFDNLGPLGQAWMVLFAPSDAQGQAMFPKLHAGASQSKDVLVRLAYLAVHGRNHPAAVTAAAGNADVRISSFAKALQMP